MEYFNVSRLAGKEVNDRGKYQSKKLILHIITGLNDGGAEGVLVRLCENSKSFRHVVVSLMDVGKYGHILIANGIEVHCLDMKPNRPSLIKFLKLIKIIRKESPHAVQTWMYHADFIGGIASRLAGVQNVVWGIRHSAMSKNGSKWSTLVMARLCAYLSKYIPRSIICCANRARDSHVSIGYDVSKCSVVHNGFNLSKFRPQAEMRERCRRRINIPEDQFLIGMVGRFAPVKDHQNLVEAIASLSSHIPKLRCLLVGQGLTEDNESLNKLLKSHGVSDLVILGGPRTDIAEVMNTIDLHVLSSMSEGFPNVLAEAMACGTPCVTTCVGDALEIVGDPDSCCPPRNPSALADLIAAHYFEWEESPELWAARKSRGASRIRDNFALDNMVKSFENIWLLE